MKHNLKTKIKFNFKTLTAGFLLAAVFVTILPVHEARAATTYLPADIKFELQTDASIYRVVKGGTVDISLHIISLQAQVGDSLKTQSGLISPGSLVTGAFTTQEIQGFYAAAVSEGVTNTCTMTGCSFDEGKSSVQTAKEFDTTLNIKAASEKNTETYNTGANVNYLSRNIYVFPVVGLSLLGTDAPYTATPALVSIEVFERQADLEAVAKDNADTDYIHGGDPVKVIASASPGTSDTLTASNVATQSLLTLVYAIFSGIIGQLESIVKYLGTWIVIPLVETALSMSPSEIVTPVYEGWTIIRDVVNMLFILVLIIIGFATMLRLESYNYKKLLVNLILMAILVNFSMVIARIIIEFAAIIQNSFLPAVDGVVSLKEIFNYMTSIQPKIIIDAILSAGSIPSLPLLLNFKLFFEFFLTLAVFITFAALAVYLVIRIVALWVLLILSPFAYGLSILPATSSLAKQWWTSFIKYVLFTPILAFFLRLTFSLYSKGITLIPANTTFSPAVADRNKLLLAFLGESGAANTKVALYLIVIYGLVLGFTWAGIIISKKMGVAGAEIVTKFAEKGIRLPLLGAAAVGGFLGGAAWKGTKGVTGAGVGLVGRWYATKTREKASAAALQGNTKAATFWRAASFLNPQTVKEAWTQRAKEKEEEAYGPAVGAMRDTLNRIMPTEWKRRQTPVFNKEIGKWEMQTQHLGRKTYFEKIASEQIVNKKAKEINEANLSEDERVSVRHGATTWIEMVAAEKALIHSRHEDGEAITRMQADGKDPAHANYDAVRYQIHVYNDLIEKGGLTAEQAGEQKMHMSEMAEGEGKLREAGSAETDVDGVIRAAVDLQGLRNMAKFTGVDSQGRDGNAQFLGKLRDYGVLNKQNEFIDADGKAVTLNGSPVTINNSADFENALKNTATQDDTSGKNLEYEIVGARMAVNINKRVQRGSAELVAGGIEPAAFLQQKGDGTWGSYTSFGRRLMKRLSKGTAASFVASRQGQARALRLIGINQGNDGSLDFDNLNEKVLGDTAKLNTDIAHAILSKNKMTDDQAQKIMEALKRQGVNNLKFIGDSKWEMD
ncbi:hypothetical protein D4R52_01150 [bacterium]|nr:MAG: hypothetical protein D4R52_01150 [bacterium]